MSGYRALAAAVITRAVKDANGSLDGPALGREKRTAIRLDAIAFRQPANEMFQLWCGVLDMDPAALSEAIKRRGANFTRTAGRR